MPELQGGHCAALVVPENRSKPGGRTLRLAVAIIPSETQPAAADPIVFITGGPGEDAILIRRSPRAWGSTAIAI